MEIKAIDHNVNIIAMQKNGKNYGMCCAWCTQAGADKLICCVGPQSTTGQALEKGDIVGFSNLNKSQMMIAFQLGDLQKHSADTDKLAGVDYSVDDGAILISGARTELKCQVIDILHLPGIEAENVLYLQMLSEKENGGDGSYTVRFHLRLDQKIDGQKLRSALDKTARRYPYFCVSLKRNEREFYYEINDRPVALLHTNKAITLGSSETNGHIWAVCYDGEDLFIDYFHGRSDGTGMYALIATLLYHYFDEQAIPGIKTLDTPISEEETHDPVEDLPLLDLSKVSFPASPKALNLMKASGLEHVNGKGLILKLMIPEESFLPFMRSNDGTPGIMLSVLIARAIERVHPQHEAPLVSNYVVNARPMLKADETFHNCTNRVVFHYDDRIRRMPLKRQCTVYRGKTFIQADEETIVQGMTVAGSMAQMILDLPDFSTKAKIASQAMAGTYDATTYIVSYVGRWKYPQLGRHIREFWTETPVGPFPLIEVAAVNGRIFVSFLQPFSDRRYYDALLDELKENGIEYVECGSTTVSVAEIKD